MPCAIAEDDEKEFQSLLEELIEEDQSSSSVNRDSTESTTASTSFPYLHPPSYYRQPKIGRRRSTNPTYMPELRILRRDVRRRYGEMFMNVANNHDPLLLERFVQEFCRPDCQFVALRPTDLQSRRTMEQAMQKKQDTVTNMKEMVQGFAFNFEMMPDSVFRLEECQVRVKQGTAGSVVVGRAKIRGTRIYRLELRETPNTSAISEESWESSSISSYDDVSSISTHSTTSGTSDDSPYSCTSNEEISTLEHQIQHGNHHVSPCGVMGDSGNNLYQQRYRWTPIAIPMDSLMEAIFSMSLDETHRIQRFQMACQSYQERPAGLAH